MLLCQFLYRSGRLKPKVKKKKNNKEISRPKNSSLISNNNIITFAMDRCDRKQQQATGAANRVQCHRERAILAQE